MLTILFNEMFGFMAISFLALGAATSNDEKQLKLTNVGLVFLAFQIALTNSAFAAVTIVLSIIRNLVMLRFSGLHAIKVAFMLLFVGLLCYSIVNATGATWFSILPALGGVVGSYAVLYLQRNQRTIAFLITSGIWMTYGVQTGLFSVVMTEVILSMSLMVRMYKLTKASAKL